MPFYRLYTPRGILSNAEFTTSYYNYSSTAITFIGGSPAYTRLFKLPLIPQELLTYSSDITVKITVGLQKAIRSYDSDPKFLLSDGSYGIGFEMRDGGRYHCRGIQGQWVMCINKRWSFSSDIHFTRTFCYHHQTNWILGIMLLCCWQWLDISSQLFSKNLSTARALAGSVCWRYHREVSIQLHHCRNSWELIWLQSKLLNFETLCI